MKKSNIKDISWWRFFFYLSLFWLALYSIAMAFNYLYQPALDYDNRTTTSQND